MCAPMGWHRHARFGVLAWMSRLRRASTDGPACAGLRAYMPPCLHVGIDEPAMMGRHRRAGTDEPALTSRHQQASTDELASTIRVCLCACMLACLALCMPTYMLRSFQLCVAANTAMAPTVRRQLATKNCLCALCIGGNTGRPVGSVACSPWDMCHGATWHFKLSHLAGGICPGGHPSGQWVS
jgi:hypothetical protein